MSVSKLLNRIRYELMRICLLLIIGCLSLTGCRVNPRAEREIALLRAEILDLEDQYYSLKSRCEANGFFSDDDQVYYDSTYVDGQCVNCDTDSIIYETVPSSSNLGNELESIESLDSVVDEPSLHIQDGVESNDSASRLRFVPHSDEQLPKQVSYANRKPKSSNSANEITSVKINKRVSKGEDLDGSPGHEGLTLLIQPLDSAGKVQKLPGHITVRVNEPVSPTNERQIGLWQFTPEESTSFFVRDELAQQGILLHLPWNEFVPRGKRLNVFVRYSADGQSSVNAKSQIGIIPPKSNYSPDDPLVAGWIERDHRWIDFGNPKQPFEDSKIAVEDLVFDDEDPQFRVTTPVKNDRISAPGWRPVR